MKTTLFGLVLAIMAVGFATIALFSLMDLESKKIHRVREKGSEVCAKSKMDFAFKIDGSIYCIEPTSRQVYNPNHTPIMKNPAEAGLNQP